MPCDHTITLLHTPVSEFLHSFFVFISLFSGVIIWLKTNVHMLTMYSVMLSTCMCVCVCVRACTCTCTCTCFLLIDVCIHKKEDPRSLVQFRELTLTLRILRRLVVWETSCETQSSPHTVLCTGVLQLTTEGQDFFFRNKSEKPV